MNAYLDALRHYADFTGRARRRDFWLFVLFNLIFMFVAAILDMIFGTYLFYPLYSLGVLLPSWAVAIRRLHDTDHCGWWILIGLVPFIGWIWLLVLYVQPGTSGENRYGFDPQGPVDADGFPTDTEE